MYHIFYYVGAKKIIAMCVPRKGLLFARVKVGRRQRKACGSEEGNCWEGSGLLEYAAEEIS